MSFIDSFEPWMQQQGDMYIETFVNDPQGGDYTWTLSQANLDFGFYVEKSAQTNVNEQFVDDKIGKLVFRYRDLTFTPTIKHKLIYNSQDYFITGVDNVGLQNEVYLLSFRKENG